MQQYRTIATRASGEFTEKRSRFIGTAIPIGSEEEALALIAEMRERHWDASHNVYAYILREGRIARYTDDGEPQGTAGIPMLDLLQKEGLTDLCVVVTRYFGGVLLGTGGLVRAYSQGARLAVEAAGILTMCPAVELRLEMDYAIYGKVAALLPRHQAVTESADFGVAVTLNLLLREEFLAAFCKELTELTAATVHPQEMGRRYLPIPD